MTDLLGTRGATRGATRGRRGPDVPGRALGQVLEHHSRRGDPHRPLRAQRDGRPNPAEVVPDRGGGPRLDGEAGRREAAKGYVESAPPPRGRRTAPRTVVAPVADPVPARSPLALIAGGRATGRARRARPARPCLRRATSAAPSPSAETSTRPIVSALTWPARSSRPTRTPPTPGCGPKPRSTRSRCTSRTGAGPGWSPATTTWRTCSRTAGWSKTGGTSPPPTAPAGAVDARLREAPATQHAGPGRP